jgi:hypothetical protein
MSTYDAAEFLWLFDGMDKVTEGIWVEAFDRVYALRR